MERKHTEILADIKTSLTENIPYLLRRFINIDKLSNKILDAMEGWLG